MNSPEYTVRAPVIGPLIMCSGLVVCSSPANTNPQFATGPQKCVVLGPVGELRNFAKEEDIATARRRRARGEHCGARKSLGAVTRDSKKVTRSVARQLGPTKKHMSRRSLFKKGTGERRHFTTRTPLPAQPSTQSRARTFSTPHAAKSRDKVWCVPKEPTPGFETVCHVKCR